VLAHAADCRVGAYIATARCALAVGDSNLTLWLDDSRASGTVHASEIRWLYHDLVAETLVVEYVEFPAAWSQIECDLADVEYAATTDWEQVRAFYQAKGLLGAQTLVDHLQGVSVACDNPTASASRHVTFNLKFRTDTAIMPVLVSGTIRDRVAPVK
jgi:hypothetical protein